MTKIIGIFLAVLTFFSSTLNVFADAVEVYEEKSETINKEDYDKYKEKIEKKVLELNEQDDDYIYDYEVSIVNEEDEVIITERETVSSQEKFTSIEEAALAEINVSPEGSTIIVSGAYSKDIDEIEEIKDMEFDSEKEALDYIAEQALQGYVVSNTDIKESSSKTTTGKVETGVKISAQNDITLTAPKSSDYILIKKGSNEVAVWTKDQTWTVEQQENFKKSITNYDSTINDKTTFTFISGYKTFDLSYLGNDWGKAYNFSINDSGLIEVTPESKSDISYIVAGTVEYPEAKVLLNCTLTKKVTLWYVDLQKTTLGYDYAIVGGASTIARDLFKVQSILTGKIYNHTMTYRINTTNKYTSYVASFDVYKEETRTMATVAYKIIREKAATGNVRPGEGEQITPPNTGVEVNFYLQGALLISILVAAISLKKLCK